MTRGRPQDPEQQEKVQAALINAMRDLLCTKTYKSISIREVAKEAGTYSAMISYYFESKEGLLKALILRTAQERQSVLAQIGKEVLSEPDTCIQAMVAKVLRLLLKEPWLFRLIQDELMAANESFKQFFLQQFVQVVVTGLHRVFSQMQQQNIIRDDVNLDFLVPTFMSVIGFPIIALPLLQEATGLDAEVIRSEQWQQHISDFLMSHLTPRTHLNQ